MNIQESSIKAAPGADDPTFTPMADYFDPDVHAREKKFLWPKAWIIVCRVEELEKSGDFVTLDIGDETFLVVRDDNEVRAFHNVCQHRGRKLKSGTGNTGKLIRCPFHGWSWKTDGTNVHVTDREDWEGLPACAAADLSLPQVRLESWGGWYWVTGNPDMPALLDYLAPIPAILANHELESCRREWYQSIVFPCNWKNVIDAFNEAYHVEATHPQLSRYGRPRSLAVPHGMHGMFCYPSYTQKVADAPAGEQNIDFRQLILEREDERDDWLHALVSPFALEAAKRMREELPEGATYQEVNAYYARLHRECTEAAGAKWPDKLTIDDIEKAGTSWHIFPNTIFLPSIDGALWYRARPNGDDTNSCIFDVWWIRRFAPGTQPKVEHEFYTDPDLFRGRNRFLEQDFDNLLAVQSGVKSSGFRGSRLNPVQEAQVKNFHTVLHRWLESEGNPAVFDINKGG